MSGSSCGSRGRWVLGCGVVVAPWHSLGAKCFPGLQRVVGQIHGEGKSLPRTRRLRELWGSRRRPSKPTPAPSGAARPQGQAQIDGSLQPPGHDRMAQGHPGRTRGCSGARSPSRPGLLQDNGASQRLPLRAFALIPPNLPAFSSLAGSGGVAEHQESQRGALIRGYCLCSASSTLPPWQSRSRPPFLLRQEAAGGDVEPQYESLQLGLFCCLPRLISFNYLLPFLFFFSPSPSQILSFFQVIIFLLSPQPRLALPVCLQLPSLLPAPSISPLLFSTRSSLHTVLPAAPPPAVCLPGSFFLGFFFWLFFSILLTWMTIAFLHPIPGTVLAVCTAGARSLAVIPHPGLGWAPSPTAILPGYCPNPDVAPL